MHSTAPAAGAPRELDAAVARVRATTGEVVGSGFLVTDRLLVTCAHVVAGALGRSALDQTRPE